MATKPVKKKAPVASKKPKPKAKKRVARKRAAQTTKRRKKLPTVSFYHVTNYFFVGERAMEDISTMDPVKGNIQQEAEILQLATAMAEMALDLADLRQRQLELERKEAEHSRWDEVLAKKEAEAQEERLRLEAERKAWEAGQAAREAEARKLMEAKIAQSNATAAALKQLEEQVEKNRLAREKMQAAKPKATAANGTTS